MAMVCVNSASLPKYLHMSLAKQIVRQVVAWGFLAMVGGVGWGMMKYTVPDKEEMLKVSGNRGWVRLGGGGGITDSVIKAARLKIRRIRIW